MNRTHPVNSIHQSIATIGTNCSIQAIFCLKKYIESTQVKNYIKTNIITKSINEPLHMIMFYHMASKSLRTDGSLFRIVSFCCFRVFLSAMHFVRYDYRSLQFYSKLQYSFIVYFYVRRSFVLGITVVFDDFYSKLGRVWFLTRRSIIRKNLSHRIR